MRLMGSMVPPGQEGTFILSIAARDREEAFAKLAGYRTFGAGADVVLIHLDDANDAARGPGEEGFLRRSQITLTYRILRHHEPRFGGHRRDRVAGRFGHMTPRDHHRAILHQEEHSLGCASEVAGGVGQDRFETTMFDGVTLGLDQMRLAQQTDDAMRRRRT